MCYNKYLTLVERNDSEVSCRRLVLLLKSRSVWAEIRQLLLDDVQFYFPRPHHPWQRGTNENTNGLLREYFPKGKDLTDITDDYIQNKIYELNKRPRKCLGYKTPYEVYYSTSLHLT